MPEELQYALKERARAMRRSATPAEAHVWEAIRKDRCGGLRFLRQFRVRHFIVDFYCAKLRFAIEVDGSVHDRPEIAKQDRMRQAALELEAGIRFLRLTSKEALALTPAQLCAHIQARLPTPPHPLV